MLEEVRAAARVSRSLTNGSGNSPNGAIRLDVDKPMTPCLWFTRWSNGEREMCVEREVVV
jgi:hypothetical protein